MNKLSRKTRIWLRLIPLFILIAALAAVILIFWVREIDVKGVTKHTPDEVRQALSTNLLEKNSLYLMWEYRKGELDVRLPYLESLTLTMDGPGKVLAVATEKEPVGFLDKGNYVYFDENGLVLEISDEEISGIPVVIGLTTQDPILYQKIPSESESQLQTALKIIKTLGYHDLHATQIRFDDEMDITVMIGHTEVLLGKNEYLDEKIANLKAILDTMENTAGTLHMENFTGKNEAVTFSDANEKETESPAVEQDPEISADSYENSAQGEGQDGEYVEEAEQNVEEMEMQEEEQEGITGAATFPVFNSSGQAVSAHVVNGQVLDSYGNPIPGCSINEAGHVVDAYMNELDPDTGEWLNQPG